MLAGIVAHSAGGAPQTMSQVVWAGVAARLGETRLAMADSQGQCLARADHLEALVPEVEHLCVACTRERQAEMESWLAQLPGSMVVWTTSWPDAALAGAFTGQPGLLLTTEHWTMYDGCACKDGPEEICQALAMVREASHRTLSIANGEGGLEWLCREGLRLLEEVSNSSRHPLELALRPHQGPRQGLDLMRERAYAVRSALQDLADYPGPEPASLAVLAKGARRLSDLLRTIVARVSLSSPARAAWLDGQLEGPLWEAMDNEFRRYLPHLRWQSPESPPEIGCIRLIQGALKELERKALDPRRPPIPAQPVAGRRSIDADAWRQLSRMPRR